MTRVNNKSFALKHNFPKKFETTLRSLSLTLSIKLTLVVQLLALLPRVPFYNNNSIKFINVFSQQHQEENLHRWQFVSY